MPIAYFDPDTLVVHHTISYHDASYDPSWNGEHFLVHDLEIPHDRVHVSALPADRIHVARGAHGLQVSEKRDMTVTSSADRIVLGDEAVFRDVPHGAIIKVNGGILGEMDDSGVLEFTPRSSGFYTLRFSLVGHMDQEFALEVVCGG